MAWQYFNDTKIVYTHYLTHGTDPDVEDAFKRHLLLELLATFGLIEYERGYDGHYYDVYLKIRDANEE